MNLPSTSVVNQCTPFTQFVLDRLSNDDAQHIFVWSFAEHVRQDPDAKVIDFGQVFKWLGFDRKDNAVRLLRPW